MTLDSAILKATLFHAMIGAKVKNNKNGKIRIVMRITAYRKELDEWDVAVFFEPKHKINTDKPNCFLSKFIKEYEVVSEV